MHKTEEQHASRICVGVIAAAHGIRGEVKVISYTQNPEDITTYGTLTDEMGAPVTLSIRGRVKNQFIARVEGVSDRNTAETLRNRKLFIDKEVLPSLKSGSFYHVDLMGLKARNQAGEELGYIHAIHNFGAGDILEIMLKSGKKEMLSFTDVIVPEIHVAEGYVVLCLPNILEAE